jgi:hypothetical protein
LERLKANGWDSQHHLFITASCSVTSIGISPFTWQRSSVWRWLAAKARERSVWPFRDSELASKLEFSRRRPIQLKPQFGGARAAGLETLQQTPSKIRESDLNASRSGLRGRLVYLF